MVEFMRRLLEYGGAAGCLKWLWLFQVFSIVRNAPGYYESLWLLEVLLIIRNAPVTGSALSC